VRSTLNRLKMVKAIAKAGFHRLARLGVNGTALLTAELDGMTINGERKSTKSQRIAGTQGILIVFDAMVHHSMLDMSSSQQLRSRASRTNHGLQCVSMEKVGCSAIGLRAVKCSPYRRVSGLVRDLGR
jgi:hypothetical protein